MPKKRPSIEGGQSYNIKGSVNEKIITQNKKTNIFFIFVKTKKRVAVLIEILIFGGRLRLN